MKSQRLFGQSFACECGRTHQVEPREVVYAAGAAGRVPAVCRRLTDGRRVGVLMDVRTRAAAGAGVAEALSSAGWEVGEVVVPDPPGGRGPVCDDHTFEAISGEFAACDLVLPVGAGVINDLGKWIAHERHLAYACFATAASMNGHASANIAPTIAGVKRVVYARAPAVVFADPDVLADAPYELTAAGLGDVLAKSVSSADWYLNSLLFGDYYCRRSVELIAEIEPLYMDRAEDLPAGEPDAIEALFDALLLTGAAMNMAGTSFPASGGEHMVSHCLDMMSLVDGADHDLHGRQVGLGTILTSELYRRILELDCPEFAAPDNGVDSALWGPLADVMAEEYAGKVPRIRRAAELLAEGDAWDRLRERVAPMLRRPETVRDCLARAGGACSARDIGCALPRLRTALLHAHEIRSRFTVVDLARLVGVMPAAVDDLLDEWA